MSRPGWLLSRWPRPQLIAQPRPQYTRIRNHSATSSGRLPSTFSNSSLRMSPRTFWTGPPTLTYCATKAAIHSYTQSLRHQLRASTIDVLELIPPYVATDLLDGASDPHAMPLDKFIAEVMHILTTQPMAVEICVENVKRLRFAAESGRYDSVFRGLNDALANASH